MTKYILFGIIYGIFAAILIGQGFFMMMHMSSKQGFYKGLWFVIGVDIVDPLIAAVSYYSVKYFLGGVTNIDIALRGHIAAIISIIMGIFMIVHKVSLTKIASNIHESLGYAYAFFKGALVNLSNPIVWMIGLAVASYFVIQQNGRGFFWFVSTVFTIVFVLDIVKIYYVDKITKFFSPKVVQRLQRGLGVIIIIIGLMLRRNTTICAKDTTACVQGFQTQIEQLFDKRQK